MRSERERKGSGSSIPLSLVAPLLLSLFSCTAVHQVHVTRMDGTRCETTKVNPVFYSGETWTDCIGADGKVATIQTQHSDLSMLAGLSAVLTIAAGAALSAL